MGHKLIIRGLVFQIPPPTVHTSEVSLGKTLNCSQWGWQRFGWQQPPIGLWVNERPLKSHYKFKCSPFAIHHSVESNLKQPDLSVAEGPYTEVVKLQTMRCLFEAYEHVLSLLENVFTPMFCHSDEVSDPLCPKEAPPAFMSHTFCQSGCNKNT